MTSVMLPIEPFRLWLKQLVDEIDGKGSAEAVASRLNTNVRTINRYLTEATVVREAVVDAYVSADGRVSLWDLYPEQLG